MRAKTVLCVRRSGCYDGLGAKGAIFKILCYGEIDGFRAEASQRDEGILCVCRGAAARHSA